jgi:hypothetical protein
MSDFPNKVELEYQPYSNGEAVTVDSLVKWLDNEISIFNEDIISFKAAIEYAKKKKCTITQHYNRELIDRSEAIIEAFNHLKTELQR